MNMLTLKELNQIRTLLIGLINNVRSAHASIETLEFLDQELNGMLLRIREQHGDKEAHAIEVLFNQLKTTQVKI